MNLFIRLIPLLFMACVTAASEDVVRKLENELSSADNVEEKIARFIDANGLIPTALAIGNLLLRENSPVPERDRLALFVLDAARKNPRSVEIGKLVSDMLISDVPWKRISEKISDSLVLLSPNMVNDLAKERLLRDFRAGMTNVVSIKLVGWCRLEEAKADVVRIFETRLLTWNNRVGKSRDWRDDVLLRSSVLVLARYGEARAVEFWSKRTSENVLAAQELRGVTAEWLYLQSTMGADMAYIRSREVFGVGLAILRDNRIKQPGDVISALVPVVPELGVDNFLYSVEPTELEYRDFEKWLLDPSRIITE